MVIPGWTVVREIPPEVFTGIITGKYKVWGGVIRWAAGTENAGQIVRHLVTSPLSGQVNSLSQMTQQVLQMATGTAILSGLNLAVSCVGFVVINNRLNGIDNRLQEIKKDVKEIKSFLESSERAKLFAALKQLLKASDNIPVEHRNTILHNSRNTLAEINMRYQELLSHSNTIEMAMANEEYFSLTALAHVRCTAELGMLEIALQEIDEMNLFWQTQARRVAQELLIGEYPQRFIATDFVDEVSVLELIKWLDFTYKEEKGLFWIEELRRNHINEFWYSKGLLRKGKSGLNQNVGIGLEKEKTLLIPALRKLMARSEVFEGYVSQYELLKNYQMKPSEFEKELAVLPESSAVNGHFILEPAFELTGF